MADYNPGAGAIQAELNNIGGLTNFDDKTGDPTAYQTGTWVEIFSDTTTKRTELVAIKITNSGSPTVQFSQSTGML